MENMKNGRSNYGVAVIGAGPAGMMAAVTAAENGAGTILLEKNTVPGRKLLLTGGGRCNFANAENDLRKLTDNYGKPARFCSIRFLNLGQRSH